MVGDRVRLDEDEGLHLAAGPLAADAGDRLRLGEALVVVEVLEEVEERRLLALEGDLRGSKNNVPTLTRLPGADTDGRARPRWSKGGEVGGDACGSLVHAMMVSFEMPESSMAFPKASSSSLAPIQLRRSASASNGLADACTPV